MFTSQNPATEEILATFPELTDDEIEQKLASAERAFRAWRLTSWEERRVPMKRLAERLRNKSVELGTLLSQEVGKPLKSAKGEIEKCAWVCDYYADNAEAFLKNELIETDASKSYIQYQPLGIVLAVMPWNFPFWQVMRFAAPAVMAGNVGILKHASNVPQCANALEAIFIEAGFPTGVFQNFLVRSGRVEKIIRDPRVKAVTLTGSEYAGQQVASVAGQEIKKTVLELGGSDPFIVFSDADLTTCCDIAATARLQNAGQSCIAAKRFILMEDIADAFLETFKKAFENMRIGNPLDETTTLGPLATAAMRDDIEKQVNRAIEQGATVLTGGKRVKGPGFFYEPTILTGITSSMDISKEELFGPVAMVMIVKNIDEAIRIANETSFGLGSSIWTQDQNIIDRCVRDIEAGSVFVNGMVKSDPRLPFGGIKRSGYGRELSLVGMREFVNTKTIWVK